MRISFLLLCLVAWVAHAADVSIDWASNAGPVKPVNGVGQPPMLGCPYHFSLTHYLKEAGIPYSRLHDVGGWLGHGLYVDIPNLFPDFNADETKAENYTFDMTDMLLLELERQGVEPFFRLGITIENWVSDESQRVAPRRSIPPKDPAKWARIAEHVMRHYTEGWANGYRMKITYWEIWNEPENHPDARVNPMWRGDWKSYCDFYGVVATHLKAKFPHLKIGGYASCGFYAGVGAGQVKAANSSPRLQHFVDCAHVFLKRAKAEKWPLDFFSYHSYSDPAEALRQVAFARELLDSYGFQKTETSFNEWLPCVSHQNLGTAKQASAIAAELIGLQNGPCDTACIYDARCGLGNYSPLFNPMTYKPHKAYYAFMAFNELRKLGTAVKSSSSDKDLWVTAAKGASGKAVMLANYSKRSIPFRLDDTASWRVRITDAQRTWEEATLPPELGAETFLIAVRDR